MPPKRELAPEERVNIETQLYSRVIAAREAYQLAKAKAQAFDQIRGDLGLSHPDGRAAALKAAQIERAALETYGEVLREFTAFILRKRPRNPNMQQ